MESEAHRTYVFNIVDYIERKFDIPRNIMAIDDGESLQIPPKNIHGFRADVYVHTTKFIIIGEAKTDNDIDNKHTEAQLKSYIKEIKTFSKERHVILSSSMMAYPSLRNYIRRLLKSISLHENITFHTVDPYKKGEILL